MDKAMQHSPDATASPAPICYEHPLNERVRIYLRVESLLTQLKQSSQFEGPHHYQLFFNALFDLMELLDQIQLKAELLKDIDKQIKKLKQWLDIEGVDQSTLQALLDDLTRCSHGLSASPRLGQGLREDRFLSAIRQRFSIPGGTCCFDLPILHHWLHSERYRTDIQRWLQQVSGIDNALSLWLRLARDSGRSKPQQAKQGFYQSDAGDAELLRLYLDPNLGIYPMISGHRSRFAVRFLPFNEHQTVPDMVEFGLAHC